MQNVKPVPVTHHHKPRAFVFKELPSCTHVFLKTPLVKKSLERPYTGPHKVLERISNRDYKIDVNGSPKTVSTELLKPAHFIPEDLELPTFPDTVSIPEQRSEPRTILKTYAKKKNSIAAVKKVVINTKINQIRYI